MAERRGFVRRAVGFVGRAAWAAVVSSADMAGPRPEAERRARREARSLHRGDPRER